MKHAESTSPFGDIETNPRHDNDGAARYIGIQPQTLNAGRCTGKFKIPYFKVNKKVIYMQSDLDVYLVSRRVDHA